VLAAGGQCNFPDSCRTRFAIAVPSMLARTMQTIVPTIMAFKVWFIGAHSAIDRTQPQNCRKQAFEHDNAMNIGEWLPATATFSDCRQNNHRHYPVFCG